MKPTLLTASDARPAGLVKRGAAAFVDFSVVGCGGFLVLFPVVFVLGYLCFFGGQCMGEGRDRTSAVAWYLATLIIPTAYFLVSWSRIGGGRTPGMRAFGIRLVRPCGDPPGLRRAAVRLLVLAFILVPGAFWEFSQVRWLALVVVKLQFIGVIALFGSVLLSRDRRGIHDRLAGTMVVVDDGGRQIR